MITHVIYHIFGRKVGCTKNLTRRKEIYQLVEGIIPEIKVLEELDDKTDQEAGDIEWQWADKLGYKRGLHYTHGAWKHMTREQYIEIGRKGGRRTVELGKAGYMNLTIEQRRIAGKMGGYKKFDPTVMKPIGSMIRDKCPHCNLESNRMILKRWHFENCKKRPMVRGN